MAFPGIVVTFQAMRHQKKRMKHPDITTPDTPASSPADDRVIAEVMRGNREMFEVIVRRYNQQLFRIGLSYLRQPERVEDAMQNAYLKAFLHLRSFQGSSSFSTWLTRIMINECLMLIRRQKKAGIVLDDEASQLVETIPSHPSARSQTHLNEMKALIESAVASLPEKQRVVFILREVQHLSTEETASCLGISVESVKVRLHRARALLKEHLLQSAAGLELFPYRANRCNALTARVMTAILSAV